MKRGIFFAIVAFALWVSSANSALAGFGITPPYVRNDTLRPGSEYTQEIIIVRSDPLEDLDAELTMNLPGIESWFSTDKGTKFVLPKGESQVKLQVTVRVPDDTKLGEYNGNIRIRTVSQQAPTTGVSLALGAQIDVHLKVVNEVFDFEVRRVELPEAESGQKKWWLDFPGKITFGIYIANTGNVPAAPPKVTFEIYDVSGVQLLESTANTNKITTILPFDTKKVIAYIPTWLPPGSYRVKYNIHKDETESAQKGELALSILPRGTIPGYVTYGFEGLKLGDQLSIVIPAAVLLLVVITLTISRKQRRPRRRSRREYDDEPRDEPPRVRPRVRASGSSGVVDLSRRRR
jgi:hypothetical protein